MLYCRPFDEKAKTLGDMAFIRKIERTVWFNKQYKGQMAL